MSAHDFEFKDIDGERLPLAKFAGHPLLVVNTASECGFTPQYAELQGLWSRYRDAGLIVLGVPSNDFGAQEPGDEAAIKQFCSSRYGVDFPMTAKQRVIGAEAHPFYQWIAEQLGEDAAPRWNFHKYLIAPDGAVAGLWPSKVSPLDGDVTAAIEGLLPAKGSASGG
jgi:glutathione peroxidase